MAFYLNARQTKIIGSLLILAFLVLVWLLSQQSQTSPLTQDGVQQSSSQSLDELQPASPTPSPGDGSSIFLKDFQRKETRDGKLLWEAQGKNARYSPKEEKIEIEKGSLQFMSEKNGLVDIRSEHALLHLEVSTLTSATLTGNVVVELDKKTTLRTERAQYDAAKHLIEAPGKVEIHNPLIYTEGIGMEANTEEKSVRLLKSVRSILSPEKKRKKVLREQTVKEKGES